VTLCR